MKTLAISTSSKYIGVAFCDGAKLLGEITSSSTKSENLVRLVDLCLHEAGFSINDAELISVINGPGSYSGIRGGMAAAKAFSASLNIPLVGVSTLDAVAYNFISQKSTIAIALDAVKDESNFALFTSDGSAIRRLSEDVAVNHDRIRELINQIEGEIVFATTIDALRESMKNNIIVAPAHMAVPYARNAAFLGEKAFHNGKAAGVNDTSPIYSHMPKLIEYNK